MSESQVDLSKLALDPAPSRTEPSRTGAAKDARRRLTRYVIPVGLLVGFVVLLLAAAGQQFVPATSVTVLPVVVQRGEVRRAGTPLFQAAGWIEPRPTAVNVAALAAGVVEELMVVEGQSVAKGEAIARLIAIDAELSVEQAKATLALREGELRRAFAEQKAAVMRLEKPVHLDAMVAEARSQLAGVTTELEKLPFLIKAAAANVDFARSSLANKRQAESAIAGVIIEKAVKDHAAAVAELEELRRREENLKREIDALDDKLTALSEQRQLLVDERRRVEEAEAGVASATALRDEAELGLRQARLNLDRMVVRAPISGRILRLTAFPGTRVMGLKHTAGQSSSTVVEMYDPARLQVRADVRLEDVPMVLPGAPVEIETASSGKSIRGRVLQSTSSANVQKNTLEVKVELIEPPETVRPEMLVTATFLAPELEHDAQSDTEAERMLIPRQLVFQASGEDQVWVVGPDGCAQRRTIDIGQSRADGLVEVSVGLNVTDKLIVAGREELKSGDVVSVRGEDPVIGVGR